MDPKFYSRTLKPDSYSERVGLNPPDYDAAGNIVHQKEDVSTQQWMTFDAAGRRLSVRDRWRVAPAASQENETGYVYNGDGRPVIEMEGMRPIIGQNPDPMVVLPSKYQVWSSVLGKSLTTVDTQENKIETRVYAGGALIATQVHSVISDNVVFHTADPVTGTTMLMGDNGSYTYKEESEPLGQRIEAFDPSPGYPSEYTEITDIASQPEWNCALMKEVSGGFFNMPVECQKKESEMMNFSIEGALRSMEPENPQRISADHELGHALPNHSAETTLDHASHMVLNRTIRSTDKPDTGTSDCPKGTDRRKDDLGDWQCVGVGESTVEVRNPRIDMSDTGVTEASIATNADCNEKILLPVSVNDRSGDGAPTKFPFLHRDVVDDFSNALNTIYTELGEEFNKRAKSGDTSAGSIAKKFDAFLRDMTSIGVTELFRTYEHQENLYKISTNGGSKYPAAHPDSYGFHQLGVAFDMKVATQKIQIGGRTVREIFEENNFTWFGPKDKVHFTHKSYWETMRGAANLAKRKAIADKADYYFKHCLP